MAAEGQVFVGHHQPVEQADHAPREGGVDWQPGRSGQQFTRATTLPRDPVLDALGVVVAKRGLVPKRDEQVRGPRTIGQIGAGQESEVRHSPGCRLEVDPLLGRPVAHRHRPGDLVLHVVEDREQQPLLALHVRSKECLERHQVEAQLGRRGGRPQMACRRFVEPAGGRRAPRAGHDRSAPRASTMVFRSPARSADRARSPPSARWGSSVVPAQARTVPCRPPYLDMRRDADEGRGLVDVVDAAGELTMLVLTEDSDRLEGFTGGHRHLLGVSQRT